MAAFMHRFGDIQVETTIAIDQLGFSPIGTNHEFTDYDYYAVGTSAILRHDSRQRRSPSPTARS